MIALSIRQPWAWLIVHGFKDIENRSWSTGFHGDFLVHAGKGMTRDEYEEAQECALDILGDDFSFPTFDDLDRGGIVGAAKIVGCVRDSKSPWFFGDYGFLLQNAIKFPFAPCRGQLGFFEIADFKFQEGRF